MFKTLTLQFVYSTKRANRVYYVIYVWLLDIINSWIIEESICPAICYSCNLVENLKGISFRVTNAEAMERFQISLKVKELLVFENLFYFIIFAMTISQEQNKLIFSTNSFDLVNGNFKCSGEVWSPSLYIILTPLCWLHERFGNWDIRFY